MSIFNDSVLKDDESVWFFPTSANQINTNEWNIPIHHWVFETEEKSITRKATQKVFSEAIEAIGATDEQANSPIVHQRLMWFLVDNQRKKEIKINFMRSAVKLNKTAANGHATTHITLKYPTVRAGEWLSYKVLDPISPQRDFIGQVQLIPKEGLSIISDIDDTIKISEVLNKKQLIKNTFVNPYRTTAGFPEYYKKLKKQGAYFHYVSASPWQLQPSLKPFMDKYYPKGSMALRNFRLKDSSLLKFLQPSFEYKVEQIKKIIQRYPKHQFILIGDSGEHDPEVYAQIYKQFSSHIKAIKIRAVKGSDLSNKRFLDTFSSIPKSLWQVSIKPSD